jgi:hypothetical protein
VSGGLDLWKLPFERRLNRLIGDRRSVEQKAEREEGSDGEEQLESQNGRIKLCLSSTLIRTVKAFKVIEK